MTELDATDQKVRSIVYTGVAHAHGARFEHFYECGRCGTRNPDTAPRCSECGLTAADQEELERRIEGLADRPYDDDTAGTPDHNRKV